MKNERIILAGGSGYLGTLLAADLAERGCDVIVLTRNPRPCEGAVREVCWDGRTLGEWAGLLNGARAVVNLTGRSVNCRYTPENRREIVESRVESVKVMGEAIRRCAQPPRVPVQASSLAIYGDPGERWCDEGTVAGAGFPAETCLLWEKAFNESPTPKTRRVLLRIGFVLGRRGGSFERFGEADQVGVGRPSGQRAAVYQLAA